MVPAPLVPALAEEFVPHQNPVEHPAHCRPQECRCRHPAEPEEAVAAVDLTATGAERGPRVAPWERRRAVPYLTRMFPSSLWRLIAARTGFDKPVAFSQASKTPVAQG